MKKAIGYIRVSTEHQAQEGISLAAQETRIQAWCQAHGYELSQVFTDAGISGRKMKNRPGLKDALSLVKKGGVDAFIVYSLSRMARSLQDALSIAMMLKSKKCALVSLTEDFDTSSAHGKLIYRILTSLAEFESDLISARIKDALSYKKARGEKLGGIHAPYGYEVTKRQGKKVLIPNDTEQAVIESIKGMRADGLSMCVIADRLNERGILTKAGSVWLPPQVFNVLRREAA